ncbi:DUF3887 domain-containing protein [Oleiagrimonas sp. C23AA]|uniref:DUF3887 domain-containing protein n=1 Tax=Oleiagrimonas sp. C23AA TaxID=2719047 RepID=UPI00141DC1AF|nr:DUF3887 domain-containing protein [Oleiagrimonas sp. C23AA]NII11684.1 DUF3887 domain-containing protein [Oleiagrimonas sp. C23AA]
MLPSLIAALALQAMPAAPMPDHGSDDRAGQACLGRSQALIEHMAHGRFDLAHQTFSPKLAKAVSVQKLTQNWQGVEKTAGGYRDVGQAKLSTEHREPMVTTTVAFAREPIAVSVVCNGAGQVEGIYFRPG